jgi:hypothetical protein
LFVMSFFKIGSHVLFAQGRLPGILLISVSWVARITGMSHWHLAKVLTYLGLNFSPCKRKFLGPLASFKWPCRSFLQFLCFVFPVLGVNLGLPAQQANTLPLSNIYKNSFQLLYT